MITIVFPKCFTLNPSTANFPSMNHNSEAEKCRLLTFTSAYYRQTVKNICGSMIHIWNFLFKLAPKLKIYFVKHVPTQLYFPPPSLFSSFLSLFVLLVCWHICRCYFFLSDCHLWWGRNQDSFAQSVLSAPKYINETLLSKMLLISWNITHPNSP